MNFRILVINPGSTSTKAAVYDNENLFWEHKLDHSSSELAEFSSIICQKDYRKRLVLEALKNSKIELNTISAIAARGGLLGPLPSGTYVVNKVMVDYLKKALGGEHASNLGAVIGYDLSNELGIPSYIVDPVCVDELEDIARVSGMAEIERTSIFHALNHKAIARRVANDHNSEYNKLNMIIAHLGGGISVACHYKGRVIDVNNALDGDGPMSPERSGSVPIGPLIKMCYSGKYSYKEVKVKNCGKGGIVSYLGTNDVREVLKRIEDGDNHSKLILDAMIYQIAKEIGACSTVFKGKVDYIVLTGGLAHSKYLVDKIKERVEFIAPLLVYPGENEMLSLTQGVLRVLKNEEIAKDYTTK